MMAANLASTGLLCAIFFFLLGIVAYESDRDGWRQICEWGFLLSMVTILVAGVMAIWGIK